MHAPASSATLDPIREDIFATVSLSVSDADFVLFQRLIEKQAGIFLAPVKTLEDVRLSPVTLARTGASIDVENTGNVHFRVQSVHVEGFAEGGRKLFEKQTQGWYILAGSHKRYELEVPREACARVRKIVVSVKAEREQSFQAPLDTPGGACGG